MIARKLGSLLAASPKSLLVLGPRQVGKTTLLEQMTPDLTINLALEREFLRFSSDTSELEARIDAASPRTVFVDEVQRLPSLLNTVQALIDQSKGKLRFLLSGSSARKLRRGSANLLPGRVLTYQLGGLSCLELDGAMDTRKALRFGSLPEPYLGPSSVSEKLLTSYAATYLREEIQQESLVRQLEGFSRFLLTVAQNSGQWLDFSKLAVRAKVNRSAARRYYEILEDTLLCYRVEAFPDESLDLVKHAKYYLFDSGIVNAVLGNFEVSADRAGLLFENLFLTQLKNTAFALDVPIEVFHCRTRGGLEVDFLVKVHKKWSAVEVKYSDPHVSELRNIQGMRRLLPDVKSFYCAHAGTARKKTKEVSILPWQEVITRIFAK